MGKGYWTLPYFFVPYYIYFYLYIIKAKRRKEGLGNLVKIPEKGETYESLRTY